tara:strand:- start:23 stop:199 length:177 start_codon:yes stop_codon:yes gene_type:complete
MKKKITDTVVPFPLPKNEPAKIKRNIINEEKTLKYNPIIDPKIKKNKMNIVFPVPMPK